jgi:hypothetical protein
VLTTVNEVTAMWITPNHQLSDFHLPLSFDEKVTIFYEQTFGWQLNIAEQVILSIKNSGYASLSIVISYFELIAKYHSGYLGTGQSKSLFKQGVKLIFPCLDTGPRNDMDNLLDAFYDGCRCGLYHNGRGNSQVLVNELTNAPIMYSANSDQLIINPRMLITALEVNLELYVKKLKNPANVELRANFEKRFNYDDSH